MPVMAFPGMVEPVDPSVTLGEVGSDKRKYTEGQGVAAGTATKSGLDHDWN